MCGISGIFNFDGSPASRNILEKMTGILEHRGPDAVGYEVIDCLGFGHRRLSIIDLEGGKQPMYSHDGMFLLTFNGEIYNYVELRCELQNNGASFKTRSDTEVILELFKRHGPAAFAKLNGQFAFALYDILHSCLYLVRDRLGEKPIFFSAMHDRVIFGSEVKSVVAGLKQFGVSPQVDFQAFSDYLGLNYVPFQATFIKQIRSVKPGHYIRILPFSVQEVKYWRYEEAQPILDFDQAIDEMDALLDNATRIRLRSDVPVGVFLSGGIDSALVASSAIKYNQEIEGFTADFREADFSEAYLANLVGEKIDMRLNLLNVSLASVDIAALMQKLVFHGDSPLADSSSLPFYLLSRATRERCKVVLSGDAGDELFGGYLMYRATLIAKHIPEPIRHSLYGLAQWVGRLQRDNVKVGLIEKLSRFLRGLELEPGAAHFAWNGMFNWNAKLALVNPDLLSRGVFLDTFERLAERYDVDLESPTLRQLMLADQQSYLPDDILVKADRMSMAHGLEIRPVLTDHRIVEFSRRLKAGLLINPVQGKLLLRYLLKRRIPSYPVFEPKRGFSIPIHLWFRTSLKNYANEIFNSELVGESGFYDRRQLLKLWQGHLSGRMSLGFELWGVMVSLLWYKMFFRSGQIN